MELGWSYQLQGDIKTALFYYNKSIESTNDSSTLENNDVKFHLNCMYQCGQGVDVNYVKCIPWSQISLKEDEIERLFKCYNMKLEDPEIRHNIGFLHDLLKNYDKAREYYLINLDYSPSVNNLAHLLYHETTIFSDKKIGFEYYNLAAAMGNLQALCALGRIYYDGNEADIPQNFKKSIEYYDKAAQHNYPEALNMMGYIYQYNRGVSRDYKKAFEFYTRACNLNDPAAQNNLGYMYQHSLGVERDFQKALMYYTLSDKQGHHAAANNLGFLYNHGLYVPQNHSKAFEYYTIASNRGNITAKQNLAILYENGWGCDQNYFMAYTLYKTINNIPKVAYYTNLQNDFPLLLQDYVGLNRNEGISYLFFSNFLAYITEKYKINKWDDKLFRPHITQCLVAHFTKLNSRFNPLLVEFWFDDFY